MTGKRVENSNGAHIKARSLLGLKPVDIHPDLVGCIGV